MLRVGPLPGQMNQLQSPGPGLYPEKVHTTGSRKA